MSQRRRPDGEHGHLRNDVADEELEVLLVHRCRLEGRDGDKSTALRMCAGSIERGILLSSGFFVLARDG